MAEFYGKGTQGSVLSWRAASFLLRRLLTWYQTSDAREIRREGCRVSLWGDNSRSSKHFTYQFRHFSDRRVNARIPTPRKFLSCLSKVHWRIVPSHKSMLHFHGISDIMCVSNSKKYSTPYRIFFWSYKEVCGLPDFLTYGLLGGNATNVDFSNPK